MVVLNQNHPMLHPAHITKLSGPIFEKAPKCTKLHQHAPDSSKPDYHVTLESTRFTVKTAEHWCIICRQNWAQQSSSKCIMCTFTFTSSNWSNLSAASQYFTCNTSEQGPKQGYVSGHGRSWDPVNLWSVCNNICIRWIKLNVCNKDTHYSGAHIGSMYQFGTEVLFLVHIQLSCSSSCTSIWWHN